MRPRRFAVSLLAVSALGGFTPVARPSEDAAAWRVPRDFTYRDLAELRALVGSPSGAPPRVRQASIPPGTQPGFLFAAAQVIDQAVTAALLPEKPRRLLSGIEYQPKWWFKAEGWLDDSEVFP